MARVFLDSSVLFSACYSASGHSRDLILMGVRGEVELISSQYAFEETRRNLEKKAPGSLVFLDFILENLPIEIVKPTKNQVLAAAKHTALKDAPIVAAVKRANVDILATLDREHLLGNKEAAEHANAKVVTPREAIDELTK